MDGDVNCIDFPCETKMFDLIVNHKETLAKKTFSVLKLANLLYTRKILMENYLVQRRFFFPYLNQNRTDSSNFIKMLNENLRADSCEIENRKFDI